MSENYGPYEVLARVAEGSTSTVYRARHVELDRPTAIKELHRDLLAVAGMRDRLRAEAEILSSLSDANVVQVYDYVEEADRAWLAEEWVDGASLSGIISVHGTLTPEQAVGVVRGAVLGLAHAHDQGLLHRDVSTTNILADLEGTSKLVDFGLAAPVGTAGFSGTPAYMSPEAVRGESLTKASDVFSTAAVLFTLLSGRPPFAGPDLAATMRRIAAEPVPALEGHGSDLQDLLRRSLSKDPTGRPQDARAFLAELEEAARRRFGAAWLQRASIAGLVAAAVPAVIGGGVAAPTVVVSSASIVSSAPGRIVKSSTRKFVALGAGAAVLVVGAAAVTYAVNNGAPAPTSAAAADDAAPVAAEEEEEPPPPTLEDLTPSGRYTFERTLVSSTYEQKLPKHETRVWTLDLKKCQQDTVCSGTIASSSGSTFKYSWDGKRFVVTPPKGGRSAYQGLCVDKVTNEEVPGSLGRAVETVTWNPLKAAETDADGFPVSLSGGQRLMTTYEGLVDCDDSPTERARYQVTITRR